MTPVGRPGSVAGWIGGVDVPTTVVVTARDRAVPTRSQRRLAEAIPGAVVHEAPGGHASVFLDTSTPAAGCRCSSRRSPT